MKERGKSPTQLHEERKIFVEEAMREGAHEKIKPKSLTTGLIYVYNDDLTLKEIAAEIYPKNKSGRASTSLHYHRFIKNMYKKSSYSLTSRYNLEDLLTSKPRGDISRTVRDKITHGARNKNEIVISTGFSPRQVETARKTLKRWGVDTEVFDLDTIKKLKSLEQEEDDTKLQQIMNELSYSTILHNLVESKKKERIYPNVFTTLRNVSAGSFHYRPRRETTDAFVNSLKAAGIPFRIIEINEKNRYVILLEKHRQRVLASFEADSSLEKFKENPVKMIHGDKITKLPNTTELGKRENYISPHAILREMGIRIHPRKMSEFNSWLFRDGCPAPVFYIRKTNANRKQDGHYLIESSQKEEFKKYVLQRMQDLKQ